MNYYKETERLISAYTQLKTYIEIKQNELEELDYYPSGIGFEKNSRGGEVSSTTENTAINIINKKDKIEKEIKSTTKTLANLEKALDLLDCLSYEIIKQRYIEKKQWWEIAYSVHCSERWAKELRRRAIITISIALYGEEAMHEHSTPKPK